MGMALWVGPPSRRYLVLFQYSTDRSSGISVVMAEDSSEPFQPSDGLGV
jgi:hypothetical protein